MLSELVYVAGAFLILKLILYYLLPLVYTFYVFFLSKTIDFKKYGKWAVVTGATDGIGKAYSEQLAERGMNVVLVSRTLSKLEEVASDLREKYRIETKVIAVDFSNADIYDVLRRDLCELQIGILVNNVGMTYGYPQYFHEISKETVGALINVNMLSMAVMTHIVLPRMLERNKGIIVNMGSMGGFFSLPLLSGYSGTKAFDHFFTRGIQYENTKTSSIIIQYVAPGAVATKMIGMSPSLFVPSPSYFVRSALRSVGKLSVTTGCFMHEFRYMIYRLFPTFILLSIFGKLLWKARREFLSKEEHPKTQ